MNNIFNLPYGETAAIGNVLSNGNIRRGATKWMQSRLHKSCAGTELT